MLLKLLVSNLDLFMVSEMYSFCNDRLLVVADTFSCAIGKLQKGNSVTLEDGRVIEPSQVMDPDKPGHVRFK